MDGNASTAYNVLERMVLDESEEPRPLPLSLLETITNNFSDEMKLGSGGFAVVYKGVLGSRTVAVKLLSGAMDIDEKQFIKEVQCLMKVRHKNIVRLLGYCADTQGLMINFEGKSVMADVRNRALCFEYVSNGSLDNFITDASRGLEWRVRYKMIKGICEGLHYLHENRILHLDLKPSNILVDGNMVPKIADFGLSRIFDEDQSKIITTKLIGSIGYLAPEFYSREITLKLDIYSLGVVIMEILTGEKGFSSAEKVLESWRNRLELSQGDVEQVRVCAEIGMKCMEANRDKRPTTQDIIKMFMELGGTSSEEQDTVNSIVPDMLLCPHRLVVPFGVNVDPSDLKVKPRGRHSGKKKKDRGRLSVTVMKATSLKNKALIGKSDPYVVLYVQPFFKVKTKVIDDNLNPEWNETFELLVEDKETQSVIFEVYDKNKLQQDKKLGVAKIALNSLEPETIREITLKLLHSVDPLKNEYNTERGTLYLKVMYHPFTKKEQFEALEMENEALKAGRIFAVNRRQ